MHDPSANLNLSVVSLWELAIKLNIGKLELTYSLDALMQSLESQGFIWCPITPADLMGYLDLPLYHRDPFDRMIIAQAIARNCTLISSDSVFKAYPVPVIWEG